MAISPIPTHCLIRSITCVHAHTRFWICVDFALELCSEKAIALQVDDEQHDRYFTGSVYGRQFRAGIYPVLMAN